MIHACGTPSPTPAPPHSDPAARERHDVLERQHFQIAELNHRLRNVLVLVRTLVRKSREQAKSLDEFADNLDQRIRALSSSHELLTRRNWTPAPLRDLLSAEMEPFMSEARTRVRLDGPPVLLTPRAHTVIAMVVLELATNAAKYGALKSEGGEVAISWRHQDGRFQFSWRETGGPTVRAPTRRGFGSTVVERTVPHELGGTASINYAAEGIQADIEIPGELVMVDSEERPEQVKKPVHPNPAKGLRLLIVEDNMILALDVEDMLMRNGAAQVEVVSTCEEALAQLDTTAFDAALLDLKLTRGDSLPVAMRLRERAIPFAFATGYGERAIIPPPFATVPVIGKPYSESYLLTRLAELLERAD